MTLRQDWIVIFQLIVLVVILVAGSRHTKCLQPRNVIIFPSPCLISHEFISLKIRILRIMRHKRTQKSVTSYSDSICGGLI